MSTPVEAIANATPEGFVYLRIYELENAFDDLLRNADPTKRRKCREDVAAAILCLRMILGAHNTGELR